MKLIAPLLKIQNQLRIYHWQSETVQDQADYTNICRLFLLEPRTKYGRRWLGGQAASYLPEFLGRLSWGSRLTFE